MIQELVKQHMSSVILGGALAAVSAYVLWGGDTKPSWKRGRLRPSLENLGNTCFLNCVTQALSSVDSFYAWIEDILRRTQHLATQSESGEQGVKEEELELVITEELVKSAPMISNLYEVLTTLQIPTDGSQSTSLNKVHRAMTEHGWDTLFTQEDAYEAFQVLITSLEREAHTLLPTETSLQLPVPVQGKFLISLECVDCRTESSKRIEPFDNITLHLTSSHNPILNSPPQLMGFRSLRDMLHTYFSAETVSDVECETCSERYGMTTACDFRKQVKIAKAPKCLCIQINRTEYDNGSMTKNNEHVSFPVDSLDLTLFAYRALLFDSEDEVADQEPAVSRPVDGFEVVRSYDAKERDPPMIEGLSYALKSVIVHHGTANSGHYITYRKINNTQWLFASDDVVRLATIDELQRQQIYLLYYERQSLPEILNQSTRRTLSDSPVSMPPSREEGGLESLDKMSPPLVLSPGMHSPPVLLTPPELVGDPLKEEDNVSHLDTELTRIQGDSESCIHEDGSAESRLREESSSQKQ